MKIGLCVTGATRILTELRAHLPQDEIIEADASGVLALAAECDVLIPIMTAIPAAAFAGTPVKLVQQYGVGLEGVDVEAATRAGVWVANVPSLGTGNAESVAELAIALMMMLGRDLPGAFARFRAGRFGAPLGQALWRSTVLILGYGGIGEEIARRLSGFDARVIAVSRHGPQGKRPRDASVALAQHLSFAALDQVIGSADYVVVAAPASADNVGLVNAAMVARMKRGVFIVNIARGPVIDYDALLDGLRSSHIAGAGLDVFWREPFPADDPLLAQNVIATPHIGGVTVASLEGIGARAAAGIEALRRGELPPNCVNPAARSL